MASTRPKADSTRAGRNKPAASPDTSPLTDAADSTTTITAEILHFMVDSLKSDLFTKIDSLSASLKSEMLSVKEEFKKSIENMQSRIATHEETLTELECSATDVGELEASVDSLKVKVAYLDSKCEDMESRMRRNNIRLLGVPEGVEGPRPTEFVAQLLQELLGLEKKPLLDRAHRTLRSRPHDGQPPRLFVIRVHFFHVRNDILKKSGETSPLLYKGKKVSMFADYTTAVAKKRAGVGDVKRQLRAYPGVRYGLIYPAVLRLTMPDGSSHRFEDPTSAAEFINKIATSAAVPHEAM